jgi:hypothetical protein
MGRPLKLTPAQKAEARRRRANGGTLAELARSYNVSPSTISRLTGVQHIGVMRLLSGDGDEKTRCLIDYSFAHENPDESLSCTVCETFLGAAPMFDNGTFGSW